MLTNPILLTIALIVVIAVVAFVMLKLGVFVHPYDMATSTEVPKFDILEYQFDRELEILMYYSKGDYTIDNPYIIIDPYDFNPLAALILFEVKEAGEVKVKINGDTTYSTYEYTHKVDAPRGEIPIIGLYPGRANKVTLTFDGKDYQHEIITKPLPKSMLHYNTIISKPEKMAPGITFCVSAFVNSPNVLLDCEGQVRGYFTSLGIAVLTMENGKMIIPGDELRFMPYHVLSLFECNWLGKIFKSYGVPHGVHHDIHKLPNGNYLLTGNHRQMFKTGSREDVLLIMDSQTGEIIKEHDFRKIVDETREPYHNFEPPILNSPNRDWLHINAAIYDEKNNAIIISSPTQSMVTSIDADTSKINWILGPHVGYNDALKKYLLNPIGVNFEWQWSQHDPSILFTSDDSDIIEILLFDNGQARSFTKENSIPPSENYSRVVRYRIDQKRRTVEQLWSYGKERGADYSTIVSSAQNLGETILIDFGGQLRRNNVPVDDVVDAVFGIIQTRSRIVEVTWGGEVVYEVYITESPESPWAGTYRARRIPFFVPEAFTCKLGELKAKMVGEDDKIRQTNKIKAPKLYIGKLSAAFHQMRRRGDRLVFDLDLLYEGKKQRMVQGFIIFRDKKGNAYVYAANNSFRGRFMGGVDLMEMPPGEYRISIAAGVIFGNDVLGKDIRKGHFKTKYKVTIN